MKRLNLFSFLLTGLISLNSAVAANSCTLPTASEAGYDAHMQGDSHPANTTAHTDYYKLAVNWSPEFCTKKQKEIDQLKAAGKIAEAEVVVRDNKFQCFSDNRFGWVLHGLWAQSCDGKSMKDCRDWKDVDKHPRYCKGDLDEVPFAQLKPFLCNSPGAKLLQGEWEKHGACNFDTVTAYHEKAGALYAAIVLPDTGPSTPKLISWIKEKNAHLAGKNLLINGTEFYVCYDGKFDPIDCPPREGAPVQPGKNRAKHRVPQPA